MSEDREYYLKVPRSSSHPHGWKRAPDNLVEEALDFENRREALRKKIRELEEKVVALNAEARASESAMVFYDTSGFIYDTRHFVAAGESQTI